MPNSCLYSASPLGSCTPPGSKAPSFSNSPTPPGVSSPTGHLPTSFHQNFMSNHPPHHSLFSSASSMSGGAGNGGGHALNMAKFEHLGGQFPPPPALHPVNNHKASAGPPEQKFDLGGSGGSVVPKFEMEMQKFELMAKFEPKFEAKYEPNLSMQPVRQTSPMGLTTAAAGARQHAA